MTEAGFGRNQRQDCNSLARSSVKRIACPVSFGAEMRRRDLLCILGGAAAWPVVARGQPDLPIVAVLVPGPAKNAESRIVAIRQGMREAGLTEGINYRFASRYADGVFDRLPALASELA